MTQTILLGDICRYVTEKIPVSEVALEDYASTENLIAEKGGLSLASNLSQTGKVTKYQAGDVLVSNIRPYFKKIWFADRTGGASNDVLVLRPTTDEIANEYLYYVLANDKFFDYSTASSSGSKMPRGDKVQIMKYPVYLPDLETQKRIAEVLGRIDEKIELNRAMNETLEQMGQALFCHYFVDNPEAEGWEDVKFADVADILTGKGSTKSQISEDGYIPLYGANGVMGLSEDYLYDEPLVITGRVGTLGAVRAVTGKAWFSDNVLIMRPKVPSFGFVYSLAKTFDYVSMNRGSSQPLITQTDLRNRTVKLPSAETLKNFEEKFSPLFSRQQNNNDEIQTLTTLRDTLLPRLIGEKVKV